MKFNLKFKFILFTSLLILIIGVGSGVYFATQSKNLLEDELKKRGLSFVVQFAIDEEVRNAIYLEQPAFLDGPIERLRGLDVEHELAYCRVMLSSGKILRTENEDQIRLDIGGIYNTNNISAIKALRVNRFIIKPHINELNPAVVQSASPGLRRLRESFYDFLSPVFDKHGLSEEEFAQLLNSEENITEDAPILGYIQLGLSSARIDKKLWKILLTGIIPLFAATIIGGLVVSFFLAGRIITPVEKLAKMAARVAKGDMGYAVDVKSKDEIGILATSFNKMASELKLQMDAKEEAMKRLKEVNIELEMSYKELKSSNERLKEAQDQIIRSEKLAAVGQLASSVAHELRNPIGAIKNAIFYLKKQINKEETSINRLIQFLDIMDNEAERSNKIISDLLGFTQTSRPSVAPAKLKAVVEETLSRFTSTEGVHTLIEIDADLPEVLIDSSQIGQVFFNIIQNSYQAMPDGGELRITAGCKDEFVRIQFADTGTGIPKKIISKIFDPLFTTKTNGVGLGLAFSYNIVQRHGGKIEVRSEEGKGTVFTIWLPKKKV